MRQQPRQWQYADVSVVRAAAASFNVTFTTLDCAHQLPLLGLYNAQV